MLKVMKFITVWSILRILLHWLKIRSTWKMWCFRRRSYQQKVVWFNLVAINLLLQGESSKNIYTETR